MTELHGGEGPPGLSAEALTPEEKVRIVEEDASAGHERVAGSPRTASVAPDLHLAQAGCGALTVAGAGEEAVPRLRVPWPLQNQVAVSCSVCWARRLMEAEILWEPPPGRRPKTPLALDLLPGDDR